DHADILATTRRLLRLRREHVVPLLKTRFLGASGSADKKTSLIDVSWRFDGGSLRMAIHPGLAPVEIEADEATAIHSSEGVVWSTRGATLAPWSIVALASLPCLAQTLRAQRTDCSSTRTSCSPTPPLLRPISRRLASVMFTPRRSRRRGPDRRTGMTSSIIRSSTR